MPDWEPYPTLPVFTWGIKRADKTHKKGRLLKQAAFLWALHRFFWGGMICSTRRLSLIRVFARERSVFSSDKSIFMHRPKVVEIIFV